MKRAKVIGLTGGIASGKSTVAKLLEEKGAAIVDADALARRAVAKGSMGLKKISRAFPGVIHAETGELNRAKLGEKIFNNEPARKKLNAILHPQVRALYRQEVQRLKKSGVTKIIYDVPLLFETELQKQLDGVVVVYVPRETQVMRLMRRNSLTRTEALARMRSQWPLAKKKKLADWVIDNSGTLNQLKQNVNAVWPKLWVDENV